MYTFTTYTRILYISCTCRVVLLPRRYLSHFHVLFFFHPPRLHVAFAFDVHTATGHQFPIRMKNMATFFFPFQTLKRAFRQMHPHLFRIAFHTTCGIDRVPKQTIPGVHSPHDARHDITTVHATPDADGFHFAVGRRDRHGGDWCVGWKAVDTRSEC